MVDDDAEDGRLLQRILDPLNVRVVAVGSAEQALALIQREAFQVMIVDVHLPGLSGPKLVKLLRPRILLYSGMDEEALATLAEQCEADDWLPKGGDIRDICAKVAELLHGQQKPMRERDSRTSLPGSG